MHIKKFIPLLVLFSLVACQKAENKMLNSNLQKISESKVNSSLLINEYKQIELPLDLKTVLVNDKFIKLDEYLLNQKDLKRFYSGEDQARILMTSVKKIGSKEYLLGLIAVNFDNYEGSGSGPAQVVFLSGGENNKNNYKNTLFLTMGGKFPILEGEVVKFNNINEFKLKKYCIQSFILNNDLSKKEEIKCVGSDPSIEKKSFKFNISQLGYDEL
ncbi:hypothetical protein [Acinetobacter sp. ANC 4648]|uniref:hypothetical protein n=1 Tax=Acinetobacter sp. ANC 4648 TaxID=1977875 RepID=UPI000A348C80|nr:hypothetical protein [Acinetobacter sp. ANC 4648]OTG85139.1 hypothetical protein B9T27_02720 [Acinetobacter sp. ANC 4648]